MKVFRGREGFLTALHHRPRNHTSVLPRHPFPGLFLNNEPNRDHAMQVGELPVRRYSVPPAEWYASVLKTGLHHGFTAF